uniref:Uncharacterized protein n=1 Tax=Tanacetum cinerariifolium TaxID=118510 RepID=A0A6L2KUD4_TANCI|nr:hypothetical protein [Tanacetum cinerariifolium]
MDTSPNDVRLQIIMKIREELDLEAALEEETLNLFSQFLERVRLRRSEIIRLGSQPDNPLVDHGREILERLTGADMRNEMQMLGARHELQRSMAEKKTLVVIVDCCFESRSVAVIDRNCHSLPVKESRCMDYTNQAFIARLASLSLPYLLLLQVLVLLERHPSPCKPAHFSASLHPS